MIHIKKKIINACRTLLYIKDDQKFFKDKKKFETQDDAIKYCKIINTKDLLQNQIVKHFLKWLNLI